MTLTGHRRPGCNCRDCAASHPAVHGLALRTGCRCPDCGQGPRRRVAFDDFDGFVDEEAFLADLFNESADYAARRCPPARPARPPARSRLPAMTGPARQAPRTTRPRQPLPRHRQMTPTQRRDAGRFLNSIGWTGWTQGRGGGAVTVQDLVNFSAAGGVRQRPGATQPGRPSNQPMLGLTPRGEQLLRNDPRFQRLAPMFADTGGQRLYHIAEPGAAPDHRSHYVGTTGQSTGLRVLEHLRYPNRDRVHPELVSAARDGRLDQLQVQQGRVTSAGQVSMTHGAEVLLQNLQRADWNDPRRHGFDDEAALELAW